MFSRGLNFALRHTPRSSVLQITAKNAYSASADVYDKDPAPYFFNDEVQKLLQTITRPVPEKVFQRRMDSQALKPPVYKFMTNEQLEKVQARSNKLMWKRLQMPPVVKIRTDEEVILSKDPELQGYSEAKFVFTDITFGVSNKNRMIVIREPNGNLRYAQQNERDRLNQIYSPMKGRDLRMPRMFEDENLQPILERGDYEFVLNRACVQFDPDHPDYHRVTKATYDYIDMNMHHDKLRSTRHFGTMVFYLAWTKNIDNLLLDNITTGRIEDAALVIQLYYKLNSSETAVKEGDPVKIIEHFIKTKAVSKRKLDQAIKTYVELELEKEKLKKNLEIAHGKKSSDPSGEIKT